MTATPKPHRRPVFIAIATAAITAVTLFSAPAGAEVSPGVPKATLAQAMTTSSAAVTATATLYPDLSAKLKVVNDSADNAVLSIPFGSLLRTENEGDQTVVIGPEPEQGSNRMSALGHEPEFMIPPGSTTLSFVGFCGQMNDTFSLVPTKGFYAGQALEPLPQIMANLDRRHETGSAGQDAVWWATDIPNPDGGTSNELLEGVDTEGFSTNPRQVVPDEGYQPAWSDDAPDLLQREAAPIANPDSESFSNDQVPTLARTNSSPAAQVFWPFLAIALLVSVGVAYLMTRGSRPTASPARVQTQAAGWYPDPLRPGGHRYWDGQAWTDKRL